MPYSKAVTTPPSKARDRFKSLFADTRPLQNTHYRHLWVANIVTVIGAQLTVVAVPAQIYALTQSSAMVGLTDSSAWCRWLPSGSGVVRWPMRWIVERC